MKIPKLELIKEKFCEEFSLDEYRIRQLNLEQILFFNESASSLMLRLNSENIDYYFLKNKIIVYIYGSYISQYITIEPIMDNRFILGIDDSYNNKPITIGYAESKNEEENLNNIVAIIKSILKIKGK